MEKRLGKGLEALISDSAAINKSKGRIDKIRLKDIVPNPLQPRKHFDEEKMGELVQSIKEKGVIQPIIVRPVVDGYEIVAGERRWRAAQELLAEDIPAIIRNDIDDVSSLEIALIENIQREELNPIEEANAYQELIRKFGYTLDKVGYMVSKDKTTISNSLRILSLPKDIQKYIEEGQISIGHAKAILAVTSEHKKRRLAEHIISKGISVRETEEFVRRIGETRKKARKEKDPDTMKVEEALQHKLGTKVNIHQGKKRGRIEIQFFSNEDLDRLLKIILK